MIFIGRITLNTKFSVPNFNHPNLDLVLPRKNRKCSKMSSPKLTRQADDEKLYLDSPSALHMSVFRFAPAPMDMLPDQSLSSTGEILYPKCSVHFVVFYLPTEATGQERLAVKFTPGSTARFRRNSMSSNEFKEERITTNERRIHTKKNTPE